jgi:hypothetical protein
MIIRVWNKEEREQHLSKWTGQKWHGRVRKQRHSENTEKTIVSRFAV